MHNFRLQILQHEVAAAALTGIPCDEIDERMIGPSLLSGEEKAALHLSFLSRFELRRMALERDAPDQAAEALDEAVSFLSGAWAVPA